MKKRFIKTSLYVVLLTSMFSANAFSAFARELTYDGNADEYAREYQVVLDQVTANGISMHVGNDKETLATYFLKMAPPHEDDITFEVTITDRDGSGPGKFKPAIPGTVDDPDGTNGRAGVRIFIYSSDDESSSKADALFRIKASNYYDKSTATTAQESNIAVNNSKSIYTSIATTAGTWESKNNKWKLLLPNGKYASAQWVLVDGKWYWFDILGWMVTGWQNIKDEWYYFDDSGAMITGWIKLHNLWYYLGSDGAMLHDAITPDGYYVNSDGIWVQ